MIYNLNGLISKLNNEILKLNVLLYVKPKHLEIPKEEDKPRKASDETKRKIAEAAKAKWAKRKAAEQARRHEEEASKSVIFLDKK